jgi:hypothetical protein
MISADMHFQCSFAHQPAFRQLHCTKILCTLEDWVVRPDEFMSDGFGREPTKVRIRNAKVCYTPYEIPISLVS